MASRLYGEIPGVPEGTVFDTRAALYKAGVHRQLMGGISGSFTEAADSIVISGGYEDDEDRGDIIVYTGQGGNDTQTGKQVRDQDLVRGNMGLVKSCLDGTPVRVIRGANHRSPFSPDFGYRYDGLYRVEEFWHDVGKSGFRIWRFRLKKISRSASVETLLSREERAEYIAQPERRQTTIARIIRNTAMANKVKQMNDFVCQVCGIRLETPGGPYAEAAHIRPLGLPHNGPDTPDNILCLCPNHHLLFDVGAFTVTDDFRVTDTGQKLRLVRGHDINIEHIKYHRYHFGD